MLPQHALLRHYQPFIPTALIVVPAGEFPELRLKAWASRVVTAFVSVCLQDLSAQHQGELPQLLAAATVACAKLAEWMLMVEKYPRLLTEQQANHLYNLGWEPFGSEYVFFLYKCVLCFFCQKLEPLL